MKAALRTWPWRAAALAAPLLLGMTPGLAASPDAPAHAVIDVFPAQHWAELGLDAPPPAAEPPPERELPARIDPDSFGAEGDAASAPASPPFRLSGEWRDAGQRIFVLDGAPGLRLLCERRCAVRDAVQPGGEIAPGYRFEQVRADGVQIRTDDGARHTLPLPDRAP
jgi:hypothetical protein